MQSTIHDEGSTGRLAGGLPPLDELFEARRDYLNRGTTDAPVRPLVLASWERCRRYGVDPRSLRVQDVPPVAFAKIQEAHRELLVLAEPILQSAHAQLGERPHILALGDHTGRIIRLLADSISHAEGERANLFEGASWDERDIGSNGVGTALAEGEPVILIGPEHLVEHYVGWTCIGVPIRGKNGDIVAVLDLSTPNDHVAKDTWGWILSVAKGIEARLDQDPAGRPFVQDQAPDLHSPLQALRGVVELLGRNSGLPLLHRRILFDALQEVDRFERQLSETWFDKELFAGFVAHELRSPLGIVMGNAKRLLRDPNALLPEQQRAIEDMLGAGLRLREVVDNLLAVALGKGSSVTLEPLAIGPLLSRAIAEHAVRVADSRVVLSGPRSLPPALGNETWVLQVIGNLLSNAAKYAPPDSQITVDVRAGDMIEVRVLDEGEGLEPAVAARVFEPFYRASGAERKASGAGLGLAACKRLVELQGGRIWVAAHARRGTEFGFALPKCADEVLDD